MAGFDFDARLTNIVNALKDYNSSSSSPNLSANLATAVLDANIVPTRSDKLRPAWRGDRFPAIYCRVSSGEEEHAGMGDTGFASSKAQRFMNVTYDIVGFLGWEGGHTTYENLESDMRILARNIGAVIEQENTASGTALWVYPTTYNFDFEDVDGSLIGAVLVQLEGKYLFR